MQTNASGQPVFAVAGADGSVLSLATLGRVMNGIRPMFGFQGVGLDGKREPLDSIYAMAEANIDALAALRDCSSLSLLGYSNGAVVAFEMAHHAEEKIAVDRLVLVDCRCPASSSVVVSRMRLRAFVSLIKSFGGKRREYRRIRKVHEDQRAEYLFELIQRNSIWIPRSISCSP